MKIMRIFFSSLVAIFMANPRDFLGVAGVD